MRQFAGRLFGGRLFGGRLFGGRLFAGNAAVVTTSPPPEFFSYGGNWPEETDLIDFRLDKKSRLIEEQNSIIMLTVIAAVTSGAFE